MKKLNLMKQETFWKVAIFVGSIKILLQSFLQHGTPELFLETIG